MLTKVKLSTVLSRLPRNQKTEISCCPMVWSLLCSSTPPLRHPQHGLEISDENPQRKNFQTHPQNALGAHFGIQGSETCVPVPGPPQMFIGKKSLGQCPSTVRPAFPVLVFQLSKQQNRARTIPSTVQPYSQPLRTVLG